MLNRWLYDLYRARPRTDSAASANEDALLDAAERVMKLNGFAATTMMDVARETGRSVNYVSQQFADTASMAQAVYERFAERARATTLAIIDPMRWTGASVADIVDGYVRYQMLISRDRSALQRTAQELAEINPAYRFASASVRSELEGGMYALLLTRRSEMDAPEPERATRFVIDQIGVMVRARMKESTATSGELRQLSRFDDDEFMAELVSSSCRTLGVSAPDADSSDSDRSSRSSE